MARRRESRGGQIIWDGFHPLAWSGPNPSQLDNLPAFAQSTNSLDNHEEVADRAQMPQRRICCTSISLKAPKVGGGGGERKENSASIHILFNFLDPPCAADAPDCFCNFTLRTCAEATPSKILEMNVSYRDADRIYKNGIAPIMKWSGFARPHGHYWLARGERYRVDRVDVAIPISASVVGSANRHDQYWEPGGEAVVEVVVHRQRRSAR
ncbi:hypothetical protein C8R47DRAFT_427888 [Mycena vitilis]|nr:hypothetical protein C8R47DRAFT_427888 [Mycena vitilis]